MYAELLLFSVHGPPTFILCAVYARV